MVLYFTKLVLGGKTNLSKIWLAAHWEKRLKKCQIYQIDIEKSVSDMLSNEVVLDLRLSGHLLIGIVKIFSKKTTYLLNECNDIFTRVTVFHKIELSPKKLQAPVHKITLPDMMGILDEIEPFRFNEINIELNQTQPEEITLKEVNENHGFFTEEDDFNNFGEEDGPLNFDENIDMLSLFEENHKKKDSDKLTSELPDVSPIHSSGNDSGNSGMNASIDQEERRVPHISECQEVIDLNYTSKLRSVLTLEILSGPIKQPLRIRKGKRKLIVDVEKKLKKENFDNQLYDTSDISFPMNLAPPSKRLMLLKEIGSAEQLLQLPTQKMPNVKIIHLFKRNLKIRKTEETESSEEESGISFELPRGDFLNGISIKSNNTAHFLPHVSETHLPHMGESSEDDLQNSEHLSMPSAFNEPDFEEMMDLPPTSAEIMDPLADFSDKLLKELPSTQESTPGLLQDRIVEMIRDMQFKFEEQNELNFSDLVKHDKRRKVARKFLLILMLKKFEIIELKQKFAYDEITIVSGKHFSEACMKF